MCLDSLPVVEHQEPGQCCLLPAPASQIVGLEVISEAQDARMLEVLRAQVQHTVSAARWGPSLSTKSLGPVWTTAPGEKDGVLKQALDCPPACG